jgi:hypothetical protein
LSFGVAAGTAQSVLLVVTGYTSLDPGAPPVIERKVIGHFEDGRTTPIDIYLADVCSGRAAACASLATTCYPFPTSDLAAGACGPVVDATADVPRLDGGPESAHTSSDAAGMDARSLDSAVRDAGAEARDSHVATTFDAARIVDATVDAAQSTPVSLCPADNVCKWSNYPCVPSASVGYSCQGQFADWRMPDRAAGSKFAPSYDTTSTPGVVIDLVTGLLWQRSLPPSYAGCSGKEAMQGDGCTHAEAEAYCAQLSLDARRWRLPTKIELESLIDETRSLPAIDRVAFPSPIETGRFWTASPAPAIGSHLYYNVSFATADTSVSEPSEFLSVRCVRSVLSASGTPTSHFRVDTATDTVTDTRTELVWQHTLDPTFFATSEQAQAYCTGLGGGFRLPGLKEMLTLVDPVLPAPSLNRGLPAVDDAWFFWTTSPALVATGYWLVNLVGGLSVSDATIQEEMDLLPDDAPSFRYRAWCVR